MSGVLRLVLFQARRDRVALPVWILGITLLSFATSTAVATQFGDEASQVAILTLAAANPAFPYPARRYRARVRERAVDPAPGTPC